MADRQEYWFDEAAAQRAVTFFEVFLRHTKGEWAGGAFRLQAWQRDEIVRPLFGWKRADGTRRYRTAYIEVPRKNGKSTLASGIALYMLFADGEPGAEVYSAAADREQANIVFSQAKAMVEESPSLAKRAKIYKSAITVPAQRGTYRVLSAEAYTKHGLNASGIVFDELHAQTSRDLYDVLTTSTGARRQPLMVMITTAGVYDPGSICWEQHEYARQLAEGTIQDDSYFAYIAAAGAEDDWLSEETWHKANPGLGVTVSLEYMREQAERAVNSPAYENTFRRLHLNQWTAQEVRWIPVADWDACKRALPELAGRRCFGGLDLSSTGDLTALVLAFPPVEAGEPVWLLPFIWCPGESLHERGRQQRAPYEVWARQGHILTTPGNVIDLKGAVAKIVELGQKYQIVDIAFDRWGAAQVYQDLEAAGVAMVQMGQGFASMSPAAKEFERLVLSRGLGHDGQPVLRWNVDNLVAETDASGNIKPSKKRSRQKIDAAVAAIMAVDRVSRNAGAARQSVYEGRGVLTL